MRRLIIVGAVGALAFTSCSPVCERAGNRINNFARGSDVMAEPAAKLKEKPVEQEKKQPPLAGVQITKFKPTFKFGNGDVLYEDEKGNAEIKRGNEIRHKGQITGRHGDGTFTFLTKENYEIIFHKDGSGTVVYGPEDILDRSRTSK